MMRYFVSFGSNLGRREETIRAALDMLSAHADVKTFRVSSVIETEPWGHADQPAFLNGVAIFESERAPIEVLNILLEIEKRFGRERKIKWGPRTLDLDIVLVTDGSGDIVRYADERLEIPHPHFRERLFVLEPLAELCPNISYMGTSIRDDIEALKLSARREETGEAT